MARIDTLTNFLTDVATAIKNKKGSTDTIKASDFDTEINNLPSGSELPAKGFVVNEYDSNGYATKVTVVGMTTIPKYALGASSGSVSEQDFLTAYLREIVLPSDVTSIAERGFAKLKNVTSINLPDNLTSMGIGAFQGCTNLVLDKIPNGLTTISDYAFQQCSYATFKTIPDSVNTINAGSFATCSRMVQLSMSNVNTFNNNGSYDAPFSGAGLKAIWIGSAITSKSLKKYTLYGANNLIKVYIDKPRATVEAMTNYQYAFMNDATKTSLIICNDDEEFITKEEFDAIDWSVV